MSRTLLCLAAVLLLPAGAPRAGSSGLPPEETLRVLEEVTKLLDDRSFDGSYRVDVVSRSGPRDDMTRRHEVYQVQRREGSKPEGELVSATEAGQDITEQRRAELQEARDEQEAKGDQGGPRPFQDFQLPTWQNRELYMWEPLPGEDGLCVARFAPRPDLDGVQGTGAGRLGWHCEGLDPAWMEMRPQKLPMLVDELDLRWRFLRSAGFILSRHFEFVGVGGLPFFKRGFSVGFEVSEFRLEPGVAAGPAPEGVSPEASVPADATDQPVPPRAEEP